jgi:hypothetical protein
LSTVSSAPTIQQEINQPSEPDAVEETVGERQGSFPEVVEAADADVYSCSLEVRRQTRALGRNGRDLRQ